MAEKRTPFYDIHLQMGAEMIKGSADFMFPLSYKSAIEEHINARSNVGMQDLSTMGKLDIKGKEAEDLVNRLIVNDVSRIVSGQVIYSTICREDGGILDDITAYKFSDEHFMIISSTINRKKIYQWIKGHTKDSQTYVTDITGALALIAIQGPRSCEYLKSIVQNVEMDSLKYFHFTSAEFEGTEIIVSRTGFTGELGYELYIPCEEATIIWKKIIDTSSDFALSAYGIGAMQTLRLEKSYPLYGNDLNENYTPFHCGLDRWIKFDKGDFIGREALLRIQNDGPEERWVGLAVTGDVPAAVNDLVFDGKHKVGHVTYSNYCPTLDSVQAMAYLNSGCTQSDTELSIQIAGKSIFAKIEQTPFYDPEGLRLK